MLKIENLSFSYNSKDLVLDDVNLTIDKPGLIGILGKNGVGKTTLMRCILNLVKVKQGNIYLDDRKIDSLKLKEKSQIIGYVPQNISFSDSNVFDAILIGRRPYFGFEATAKDLEIVNKIIHDLNLEKLAFKNVNNLSGGERQKVAIARALAQEPRLLYLDEPTSSLDIKNQIEVLRLIQSIAREKQIFILVNIHDLNLAMRFFDSLVILKDSKVIKNTTIADLEAKDINEAFDIDTSIIEIEGQKHIIIRGE